MINDLRTLRLDGVDMLISRSDDLVEIRDPRNNRLISSHRSHGINRLAVCEPGWRDPLVAVTTDDGLRWLDPRTGPTADATDESPLIGATATWAGTLLAASPAEPFPMLRWDAGTGARLEPLGVHADQISALAVLDLPDGPVICAGDRSGTIHRWNPRTGARAGDPLTVGDEQITAIAGVRLPDGRQLITAATADLHRWDAATGEPIGVPMVVDSYAVHRIDPVAVDGRTELITSGHDEVVQRWDAATGERLGDPLPGRCATVFYRYGELTLAIGTAQGTVELRPLGTWTRS
ncbi:hypothetical protein GCM10010168_47820 [Actinoplanes ianthinogenes]|uniref:WD40 repeat protein n=1 Tax=Actinoplanes ianthinogenes TaxID=122358 RepID=A0ABM7LNQ1_9ACTN|nr:hypothetical protein [Actinoplanes ianthinogenes]BCJ40918.1 hypothetical protein Aiant_15750 [Actinoplanes ianthinogenes]GGR24232.1 hypothetical protein GCM10010168_47820 [Actinoplanes ianthinogenes]